MTSNANPETEADCMRTRLRRHLTGLVQQQLDGEIDCESDYGPDAFDFINDDQIDAILSLHTDGWVAREVLVDDDLLRPRVLRAIADLDPQFDTPGRFEQIVALYGACVEVNRSFRFAHDSFGDDYP